MLSKLLAEKRAAILERWRKRIQETYPTDVSRRIGSVADPFANPVGNAIAQGTEALLDGLSRGAPLDELTPHLDELIKIRAVQDFTPSQAVAFVFLLKDSLAEGLSKELRDHAVVKAFLELESRIDALAGAAFDIFMRCRERIYEIKAKEIQNRAYKLLERMNQLDIGSDTNVDQGR
jgi:hypothetical protein